MTFTHADTDLRSAYVPVDPEYIVDGIACVDPLCRRAQAETDKNMLIVSPYLTIGHLLDLRNLQVNQQLLARALTCLQHIRPDYATCPYNSAFNWPVVVEKLRSLALDAHVSWVKQHFYIVVFRSRIPPTTDRTQLAKLDRLSHAEATRSGGLLKYWFGAPDNEGRNLATCEQIAEVPLGHAYD